MRRSSSSRAAGTRVPVQAGCTRPAASCAKPGAGITWTAKCADSSGGALSLSAEAHGVDRRQVRGHLGPAVAGVAAGPQVAGGAAQQQVAAVAGHVEAVAVDEVVTL